MIDWCDKCEELMQPYLDGTLSPDQVAEAEKHLDGCSWCAKRYRFEERLRHWVKVAAESGNSAAAYNLGLRYRTGDGLQVDESAAEHWLRMASARSYSPAKLALASVR